MTIQEAATFYGVSKQAIYQRLKAKGHDIKQLKTPDGALTDEGEAILAQLFDRTSVSGEGDPKQHRPSTGQQKQEDPSFLQAENRIQELTFQVDALQKEVDLLTREADTLRNERDYLRHALDQAQQLHAMTIRMLPPPAAERKGALSWLASHFRKAPSDVEQKKTGDET